MPPPQLKTKGPSLIITSDAHHCLGADLFTNKSSESTPEFVIMQVIAGEHYVGMFINSSHHA